MTDNEMKNDTGRVFFFHDDKYEETEQIYLGILVALGIADAENAKTYLDEEVEKIQDRDGMTFNKLIGKLFESSDKRREEAQKALTNIDQKNIPHDALPYVKAYLGKMCGEFIPFDTVLTAGIEVGEGDSLQMGCGQGKTGVCSLAAYAKLEASRDSEGNFKKQIFITSSTPELAEEGITKQEEIAFYEQMGLRDDVVLITPYGIYKMPSNGEKTPKEILNFKDVDEETIKSALAKAYKAPIVFSDNATLMQHRMQGFLPDPDDGIERDAIVDEADFVLLDSYRPLQRTREMSAEERSKTTELRKVAYEILKTAKASMPSQDLYISDDVNQYADFTQKGKETVISLIEERLGSSEGIDKNKVFDYVYDALVVETVYRENRDYQFLSDGKKIVSEDRASGVAIDLPEGRKQALQIRLQREGVYTGDISPEKEVLDVLNASSFFSECFNGTRHFVSGTLGIDSDEIKGEIRDNFGVQSDKLYDIPPREGSKREDRGKEYFRDSNEKISKIIEDTLKEIEAGRPVIIGTVSEEEIKKLVKALSEKQDNGTRIFIYTAASEEEFQADKENLTDQEFNNKYGDVDKNKYKKYADFIKYEAGKENTVTIGTSILGRGLDIKPDKSSEKIKALGIHVIIDGLHETSSRNQEQFKARTARGDAPGSTAEYFSYDDIPEQYRVSEVLEAGSADEIYKNFYERVDARNCIIRKNYNDFVKCTRDQLESVRSMPTIAEEAQDKICALITARAFSIKNRVLGMSDQYQENLEEYKKEISAYKEMYVARHYLGEEFPGEKKWLERYGYGEIARRYIPFSDEREQKIFTLAGIGEQTADVPHSKVNEATAEITGLQKAVERQSRENEREGEVR